MEQAHYEERLLADEPAPLTEHERVISHEHNHGVSEEQDKQFTRCLAIAAIQQVAEADLIPPGSAEPSQAGVEQAAATSPPGHADQGPDDEAELTCSSQRRDSERPVLANVYADLKRHTVALLLDDVTTNMVMYAVRVLAADSEAHAREVRLIGATMPPDSYGAANRHAIASRHERIALRLRELESNYRDEIMFAGESLRNGHR